VQSILLQLYHGHGLRVGWRGHQSDACL